MKKLLATLVVIATSYTSCLNAQEQETNSQHHTNGPAYTIPDWQSNYHEDFAKDYIRRRAQEKTAARQARIEGMKWLGHSPSRPVVSTTPFTSSAPAWYSVAPLGYWYPGSWPNVGHFHSQVRNP